jgi:hypothetical protein
MCAGEKGAARHKAGKKEEYTPKREKQKTMRTKEIKPEDARQEKGNHKTMIEDQKSWKYKWSFKEFLPKGLLGLLIAIICILSGSRYKGIKIDKFNGDWGALIFVIGAIFLVFIILWLLDLIRNRIKNTKSDENG